MFSSAWWTRKQSKIHKNSCHTLKNSASVKTETLMHPGKLTWLAGKPTMNEAVSYLVLKMVTFQLVMLVVCGGEMEKKNEVPKPGSFWGQSPSTQTARAVNHPEDKGGQCAYEGFLDCRDFKGIKSPGETYLNHLEPCVLLKVIQAGLS